MSKKRKSASQKGEETRVHTSLPPDLDQKVPLLTIGEPPVATMTVPVSVFQMMQVKLPVAHATG